MSKLKAELIKYSKKINITNLSVLRSGSISVRAKEKGLDGFYVTPADIKYYSLKTKDIVFVTLKGVLDKKKNKPYKLIYLVCLKVSSCAQIRPVLGS